MTGCVVAVRVDLRICSSDCNGFVRRVFGTQRALLVPPGEYRVTTKMANLPDGVQPYTWAVVSADDGRHS